MKKLSFILPIFFALIINAQTGKVVPEIGGSVPFGTKDTLHALIVSGNGTLSQGTGLNPDTLRINGATVGGADKAVQYDSLTFLSGSQNFAWDYTNRYLGLNSYTPAGAVDIRAYLPGTVAQTNASVSIAGTNTRFATDFKVGDSIYINGTGRIIATIGSNIALTVNSNMGSTASGLSYTGALTPSIFLFQNNGTILQNGNTVLNSQPNIHSLSVGKFSAGLAVGFTSSATVNTAFGESALQKLTTGSGNTSMGYLSLQNNTTGGNNTSVGYAALLTMASGAENTAVGVNSWSTVASTGNDNTALGYGAGYGASGNRNSVIGQFAGANISGDDNIFINASAGRYQIDGATNFVGSTNNIFIGSNTRASANSTTDMTVIGTGAWSNGSNTTVIGNNTNTEVDLYGDIKSPIRQPSFATTSTSTTGGLITAGTYNYILTAVDAAGNTTAKGAVFQRTTTGSTSTITLTFPTLPVGAVSWNIYRSTSGTFGASSLVAAAQTGATYVDGAASTTTGTPSLVTTAFVNNISGTSGANSWINNGGKLGIGTISPDASAKVEIKTTTQGFLPPRMTTTQKNAISSPAEGLIVYDLTLHKLCVYTGSAWETITSL